MTRDRDIERVLDQFYAEGPSAMPDRLFLGVVDRIERVPQRRLAFMPRFAAMNRNVRFALAAAIVVAVVGIGAFALSKVPNVATPATPSPFIATSPSPGVGGSAQVPAALQGRWVGEPRVVPEAPEPPMRNALLLNEMQLGFALTGQGTQQQFASIATLIAPDQLLLRGASTDGGCKPRDEGTYSFSLDASGTALTFTPISDACGPRAAALAGPWARVGCTDQQGWCLGQLAPGSHVSIMFTPFVQPPAWQFAYGKFGYTVPPGWENFEDCPGCFLLTKQGAPENTGIYVWNDVVAHSQADQCSEVQEPGVGRDAASITTWLAAVPGLVTSDPEPVTIGGLHGFVVDLAVAPTWTTTCPYANASGLPLVSTFVDSVDGPGLDWNIQGEGRTRIIALDLGDGRALIINIEAQNKADYDALLPGAMEVVNTFVFNR